jgi:hypothetical protein
MQNGKRVISLNQILTQFAELAGITKIARPVILTVNFGMLKKLKA